MQTERHARQALRLSWGRGRVVTAWNYLGHMLFPAGKIVLRPAHDGGKHFLLRCDVQLTVAYQLLHLQHKTLAQCGSSANVGPRLHQLYRNEVLAAQ
jgi:hypothetical protein